MIDDTSRIQPEITIKALLDYFPDMIHVFQQNGMGYEYPGDFNCLQCPMAEKETLAQAAGAHGIDIDILIDLLKNFAGTRST